MPSLLDSRIQELFQTLESQALPPNILFEYASARVKELTNATGVSFDRLVDRNTICIYAEGSCEYLLGAIVPLIRTLSGQAVRKKESVVSSDIGKDPRSNRQLLEKVIPGMAIIVPFFHEDEVFATMRVFSQPHGFTSEEINFLEEIAQVLQNYVWDSFHASLA